MADVSEQAVMERKPWWKADRFSLVPVWWSRPAERWNTFRWQIRWLCFWVQNRDSINLGFGFQLNDQDLRLWLDLPYCSVVANVPLFPRSWHQRLWLSARNGGEE